MIFLNPHWLVLIPIYIVLAFFFFKKELFKPLRLMIVLLLVATLADPRISLKDKGIDLYVLIDRSDSNQFVLAPKIEEWEKILEDTMGRHDRIFYIDYAGDILLRSKGAESALTYTDETLTGEAIFKASSIAQTNRSTKVLVLTDGYSTDTLDGLLHRLKQQDIEVHYRLLHYPKGQDIKVTGIKLPERVLPGEKFLIDASFEGPDNKKFSYQLLRDGDVADEGEVQLINGKGVLRLSDSIIQGGFHHYEIKVYSSEDNIVGNNDAETYVEVRAGSRVLLLSAYDNDPFYEVLKAQGYDVHFFNDFSDLSKTDLANTYLVLLNNVPAWELPEDFLEALHFYVKFQGGGLIMSGGEFSFGMGGYYQSEIDTILPISMELKNEHRMLNTNIAIVMDRSGSMGMTVENGKSKMQLACEGAAQTIELLNSSDAISVIAVDTSPHVIVPMTQLLHVDGITSRVRKIQAGGGGIYVYTGLVAARKELAKSIGQKHIILFSDAADSEEPGQYEKLIDLMRKEGITVSVIALGTEQDPDAIFLKDIANRGGGRIFFTTSPERLPSIFAQETVAVARSAFIKDITGTKNTNVWEEISNAKIQWLNEIDGYNLSYIRERAKTTFLTTDKYQAPLLAWWKVGAGRVTTISFPIAGEYSQRVRSWPQYGTLLQTVSRWTMKPDVPAGLSLKYKTEGDSLFIKLYYDQKWNQTFGMSPPALYVHSTKEKDVQLYKWQRLLPGTFGYTLKLKPGERVNGSIVAGSYAIPFGPIISNLDMEWTFDKERIQDLEVLAEQTGGAEHADFSKIWSMETQTQLRNVTSYFYTIALVLFLIELYLSRVGIQYKLKNVEAQRPALLDDLKFDSQEENKTSVDAKDELEENKNELRDNSQSRKDRYKRAKLK